jgi:hypothetical protein
MAATSMIAENNVKKIYLTVIDEVLSNVREAVLDEGYDEQLLQELKNMWESKLNGSRALQAADDSNSNVPSNINAPLRLPTTAAKESNIKTEMDSATRSAFNALPTSFHSSGGSLSHQNGNKKLHTPQLDGANDSKIELKKMTKSLKKGKKVHITLQIDGNDDDSDIDDDDDDEIGEVSIHGDEDDDDADDDKANNDNSEYEGKEDPDPLNSDDDLTEPGSPDSNSDMFDTDNVIVCQYDKITRIKNRWKFHLKDGIMNINARDYLFSKANGDAEW